MMTLLAVPAGSVCRLRLELRFRYGTAGGSGPEGSRLALTSSEDRDDRLEVSMPVLVVGGGEEPNDRTAGPASESLQTTTAATAGDGVDETGPGGTVRRLRDEDAKNATRLVLIFRLPRVERSSNPPSLALASAPPSPPP